MTQTPAVEPVRAYLLDLQDRICAELEADRLTEILLKRFGDNPKVQFYLGAWYERIGKNPEADAAHNDPGQPFFARETPLGCRRDDMAYRLLRGLCDELAHPWNRARCAKARSGFGVDTSARFAFCLGHFLKRLQRKNAPTPAAPIRTSGSTRDEPPELAPAGEAGAAGGALTGGKTQYRVVPNDVLEIGKIAGEVGTIVQLGEVLVVGGDTPVDEAVASL